MSKSESNPAGANPGVYVWTAPDGKAFTIQLSLDVVDRLLQDVMSGFGAVPKRGAEVGGILLGEVSKGKQPTVTIQDYELVPIEYKRGPSYLLSETDMKSFQAAHARLGSAEAGLNIVGLFRSNTRDSSGLTAEDLSLLAQYFPGVEQVALLIRPYATRVSTAGFYFRENGEFQDGSPLGEFPFRRRELGGDEPGPVPAPAVAVPKPAFDDAVARTRTPSVNLLEAPAAASSGTELALRPPERDLAPVDQSYSLAVRPKRGGAWWLPLSFVFLLLGVLLGFEAASILRPPPAPGPPDPFNFALTATKDGDNLNVRWDRQAAAIRSARQGVLVIEDGVYNKNVELDPIQLQTGSVVYRHTSGDVKLTLELTLRERNKISEKFEWKE